jgi:hypothetical protein
MGGMSRKQMAQRLTRFVWFGMATVCISCLPSMIGLIWLCVCCYGLVKFTVDRPDGGWFGLGELVASLWGLYVGPDAVVAGARAGGAAGVFGFFESVPAAASGGDRYDAAGFGGVGEDYGLGGRCQSLGENDSLGYCGEFGGVDGGVGSGVDCDLGGLYCLAAVCDFAGSDDRAEPPDDPAKCVDAATDDRYLFPGDFGFGTG